MERTFPSTWWGVILGGSSGFGLATAKALATHGMNLAIVHRDRRGAMERIEAEFEEIRRSGASVLSFNANALEADTRKEILDRLATELGSRGRVRMLLHSIAFGNLKLVAPQRTGPRSAPAVLAAELGVAEERFSAVAERLFTAGMDELRPFAPPPEYADGAVLDEEDLALTIHSMGTSLLGWTQEILRRGLFATDARVFGLTSEGNSLAWKGYAAVAAAKTALESLSRSIAVELAPYGIRSNVIQPGVTDTPALRLIPGSEHLKAQARLRNPFGRLTKPEDVAGVIRLLSTDDAGWINGEVIRVDGGEHVSGL